MSQRRPRVLVIANPHAASFTPAGRDLVGAALARRSELELVSTTHAGHGLELARSAESEGVEVLVTFGGDGTINEAVNGLGPSASTAFFPLPGGSANVLGRIVGVASNLVDATAQLLDALRSPATRTIDLASVNGRMFTFASGLGIDAAVVERVDRSPAAKRRLGPWFFAASAVQTYAGRYALRKVPLLRARPPGGEWTVGMTAVIQNARPYTYFGSRPLDVARAAGIDSGTLSAAVLHSASPGATASLAAHALRPGGAMGDDRAVSELEASAAFELLAEDGEPLPLHVDGDFIGRVERADYEVHPAALRLLARGDQSPLPGVSR